MVRPHDLIEKATGKEYWFFTSLRNGLKPLSFTLWKDIEEINKAIMSDKKLRRLNEAEQEVARKAMLLGIDYRNHPKAGRKTYMLDESLLEMYFCIANKEWLTSRPIVTEDMLKSFNGQCKVFWDNSSYIVESLNNGYHKINCTTVEEASNQSLIGVSGHDLHGRRLSADYVFELTVHKGQLLPISERLVQGGTDTWGGRRDDYVSIEHDLFSYETKVFRATLGDILKFWGEQFGCELTPTSGGYKVIRCKIKWPILQEDLDALKYSTGPRVSNNRSICVESYDPTDGYSWKLDTTPILSTIEERIKKFDRDCSSDGHWFDKNYHDQYFHWDEIWDETKNGKYVSVKQDEWSNFNERIEPMGGGCFQYELGTRIMKTLRFFSAKLESDGSHAVHGVPMFKDCCEEILKKWEENDGVRN